MKLASVLAVLAISQFCTEALGDFQEFAFSGDIDFVLIDDSPNLLTGLGVGTTVTGYLRYGTDSSDAIVTPHGDNETDYLFTGSPYEVLLSNTLPAIGVSNTTVVVSDHTWIGGSGLSELGQILGVTIQDGDPFDGWTVRTDEEPINGIALGCTFFAFNNIGLLSDENYRSEPPAGIGGSGFDGAVFRVLETDAAGNVIFAAIGGIDSYTVANVPELATLGMLAVGGLAMIRRRRAARSEHSTQPTPRR